MGVPRQDIYRPASLEVRANISVSTDRPTNCWWQVWQQAVFYYYGSTKRSAKDVSFSSTVSLLLGTHSSVHYPTYSLILVSLELFIWFTPSLLGDAISVSIIGLFLGPMYPITMNHSGKVLPPWILTGAIGWLAGFGQAGSALLPFMTGAVAEKWGIKSLQPLWVVFGLVMIVLIMFEQTCDYDGSHDGIMGFGAITPWRAGWLEDFGYSWKNSVILKTMEAFWDWVKNRMHLLNKVHQKVWGVLYGVGLFSRYQGNSGRPGSISDHQDFAKSYVQEPSHGDVQVRFAPS